MRKDITLLRFILNILPWKNIEILWYCPSWHYSKEYISIYWNYPKPYILWYKDEKNITEHNTLRQLIRFHLSNNFITYTTTNGKDWKESR